MDILTITSIILFSWMGMIILLERLYPYKKNMPFFRDGFWVDFVWYTLIQSFFLKIIIFDWIIASINSNFNVSQWLADFKFSQYPIYVQVLFFLFVHDFYIYWFHRFQHNNKWLWRTHEAHHSGKDVDYLAGSRSHVLEIIINQTVEFSPIILLGASTEIVPIKALIDAIWGMFIHSNINIKMGKWQYIFNGPEMHQWHHADHNEVFYSNYATKFAFWDWIFGTAYLPNYKPQKWGIPYEYPKDYFNQHFFSVIRFDEKKWLSNSLYRKYFNLRLNIINLFPQHIQSFLLPNKMKNSRKNNYQHSEMFI